MIELKPANIGLNARHGHRGASSGDTLEAPNRLVMNVREIGPGMPKNTPKAGKYLVQRPDTHLMSLPTIYLHIAF